jgi:hypothetical protein
MKKRIILFLLILMLLTSCYTIAENVEKGYVSNDDSIVIVGKVTFDPPIKQEINGPVGKLAIGNLFIHFKLDPEYQIKWAHEADITVQSLLEGDYFVVEIPKEQLYLMTTYVLTAKGSSWHEELFCHTALKIPVEPEDKIIYIGNLVFGLHDNTVTLSMNDSFDEIEELYNDYIFDMNGSPSQIQKRLLIGELAVDGKLIRTQFQTSYGY